MTINEQIRRSIRMRFGVTERFTVRDLRHRAPELSHVQKLSRRLANLAAEGFLRVHRSGKGNRFSTDAGLTNYRLDRVTVARCGHMVVVECSGEWWTRIELVAAELEMDPAAYIGEVIEADLARRRA